MAGFHHGISAQEVTQGIMPMRNANTSVMGLVVTSTDADNDMYPVGTPVLLTGITQDNIDKAGTNGTLRDCLQTIRDIHNPTVVVLRVDAKFDVDSLDILLTCPARFGLMPKRLGAPEIDTPAVALKLLSIAKRRRGIVYASPRKPDGSLITNKEAIVAYRDTYGDREICIIDGEWGKSEPSAGGGSITCKPTDLEFSHYLLSGESPPDFESGAHGRFRVDGGEWVDYEHAGGYWSDVLAAFIGTIPIVDVMHNGLRPVAPFHFIPDSWTGGYLAGSPNINRESFEYIRPDDTFGATIPSSYVTEIKTATIEFATSTGLGVDIVTVMLGGNKTATACAYASWQPLPA